jgi:hypothetical protein
MAFLFECSTHAFQHTLTDEEHPLLSDKLISINLRNGWGVRERHAGSEGFLLPMKVKDRRETVAINRDPPVF